MNPPLTEAWGITYIKILEILFVFVFAIPSIGLKVAIPDDMQSIVWRYMKNELKLFFFLMLTILVFSFCYVWLSRTTSIDNSCVAVQYFWREILIALAICITLILGFNSAKKFSRPGIIKKLENKLCQGYIKNKSIMIDVLNDLITLGEHSQDGYEKRLVLESLARVITKIQDPAPYSGNDLVELLRNFNRIVTGKNKSGNDSDFKLSIEILNNILTNLEERKIKSQGDKIVTYKNLIEIGKKAAGLNFEHSVLSIISIVSRDSEALFEIGLSAFKSKNYSAALSALNKIESLLYEIPANKNVINLFLGLLAHFYTEGESSRMYAKGLLQNYKGAFGSIEECFEHAIKCHSDSLRYETTDKLIAWKEDIVAQRISNEGTHDL